MTLTDDTKSFPSSIDHKSLPIITFLIPSHQSNLIVVISGAHFLVYNTKESKIEYTFSSPSDSNPLSTIRAGCFSLADDYLILSDDEKQVYCFDTCSLSIISKRVAPKRIMQLYPTNDGFIAADKHGDVYSYPLPNGEALFLLGHVSMVTCALWSSLGYLISGDRDEKIRVSHYPKGYLIETFCLGHTEFVSQLSLDPLHSNELISAGGDSFLIRWDWKVGTCIRKIDIPSFVWRHQDSISIREKEKEEKLSRGNENDVEEEEPTLAIRALTCMEDFIAIVIESNTQIILYKNDVFQKAIQLNDEVFYACFDEQKKLWIGTKGGCFTFDVRSNELCFLDLLFPVSSESTEDTLAHIFRYASLRKDPQEEEPTASFLNRVELKTKKRKINKEE